MKQPCSVIMVSLRNWPILAVLRTSLSITSSFTSKGLGRFYLFLSQAVHARLILCAPSLGLSSKRANPTVIFKHQEYLVRISLRTSLISLNVYCTQVLLLYLDDCAIFRTKWVTSLFTSPLLIARPISLY